MQVITDIVHVIPCDEPSGQFKNPTKRPSFSFTNIRNENKIREIQKWPRARDRTSLISLRCVCFFLIQIKQYQIRYNRVCEPHRRVQIKLHNHFNQLFIQSYDFC
jgi:hypothetical protein